MSPKRILQILLDVGMIGMLPIIMAYELVGESTHEWLGLVIFIIFILHNILNYRWYKNILKGRYSCTRIILLIVNVLLLVCMMCLMVSGIILSNHVFIFLPIHNGVSLARTVHLLASYWGFVLMSIHLGLHWRIMINTVSSVFYIKNSKIRVWILRIISTVVVVYGVYAFVQQNIIDYMFLVNQFVFFDKERPIILFFIDYLSIMGMIVRVVSCISNYFQKITLLKQKSKELYK
ncbi:hypothetical protein QEW_0941 [Clostridioides difficile CD160]|nr:hypothetical protein QEW_0941 [Clostridioides difficile CD160]